MPCRKGATLVETLVACAVFIGLAVLVVSIQLASKSAGRHSDLASEVYRSAMQAADRLRGEFRGARVEQIDLPGQAQITYWLPRVVDGVMQVLPTGEPDWLPGDPALPDRAVISLAPGGWLQRDFEGSVRRLADLGPSGTIWFDMPTGSRVLTCKVHTHRVHPNDPAIVGDYDVTVRFFLGNQP